MSRLPMDLHPDERWKFRLWLQPMEQLRGSHLDIGERHPRYTYLQQFPLSFFGDKITGKASYQDISDPDIDLIMKFVHNRRMNTVIENRVFAKIASNKWLYIIIIHYSPIFSDRRDEVVTIFLIHHCPMIQKLLLCRIRVPCVEFVIFGPKDNKVQNIAKFLMDTTKIFC